MAENTKREPDRVLKFGNTEVRVFVRYLTDEERAERDEQLSLLAWRILSKAENE